MQNVNGILLENDSELWVNAIKTLAHSHEKECNFA